MASPRIAPLEAGIYAMGHPELANQFADGENPTNREAAILAKTWYRPGNSSLAPIQN